MRARAHSRPGSVPVASPDDVPVLTSYPSALWADDHGAVSPARQLQQAVEDQFYARPAQAQLARKWPPLVRLGFMMGTCCVFWIAVLSLALHHH